MKKSIWIISAFLILFKIIATVIVLNTVYYNAFFAFLEPLSSVWSLFAPALRFESILLYYASIGIWIAIVISLIFSYRFKTARIICFATSFVMTALDSFVSIWVFCIAGVWSELEYHLALLSAVIPLVFLVLLIVTLVDVKHKNDKNIDM